MTPQAAALHAYLGDAIRKSGLPADEVLVVLAQILGYVAAKQDRTRYTPEGVMVSIAENFSMGQLADIPTGPLN